MAPSIGWPASSLTIPPIVVPGSKRSSFSAGSFIGCRSSSQEMWIGTQLRRAGGEPQLMDRRVRGPFDRRRTIFTRS